MADNLYNSPPASLDPLPDCPEIALFVAAAFQRLGGVLSIDSRGRRGAGRPVSPSLDCLAGIPQMPAAQPGEQFDSDEEWNGAIKLVDYWLRRLSDHGKELVFTLVAPVFPGPGKGFDFREHMK